MKNIKSCFSADFDCYTETQSDSDCHAETQSNFDCHTETQSDFDCHTETQSNFYVIMIAFENCNYCIGVISREG